MFGCCNSLLGSSCRCACQRRCLGGGGSPTFPNPFPPVNPPVTPPVQPARLRGTEVLLTGASGGTLANGFPIPFNNLVSNNALGVTFTTSSVTIARSGTYLVNWWVALEEPVEVENAAAGQNAGIAFSATLNGSVVSTSYAPGGTDQFSGTALVTVTNTPATLQIINNSGCNVVFGEAGAQAGMTVTQFA